ncbi:ribonuclease H-like domain-containing protein [Paratissierella segnis]|uniref:Ribonuclease H-like domain-containing protein n=1 Tax=Paratissierella segnis TaxID=2763679 RepID=A0A926ERR7_9FIRM|nr:ribonuclease H-like domain-containing protein [Paratissierella segnis]MBC8588543.1 ribonuclease H-like domain-containing protein [Paratissierella segnis]
MLVFEDKFRIDMDLRKFFNNQNVCFIDIETTGLSSKYCSIYLIGLMYYNYQEKMWHLIQLFAETLDEEKNILLNFIDYMSGFDKIITFNGDTFDIPFINNRLNAFNIDYEIAAENSFDLYKYVRENKSYLNLENLKLKTLEKRLGIYREDLYSGKDCIKFYKDYIKTNNYELRDIILKHNYDDLYYLVFILQILDIIDDIKSVKFNLSDTTICMKIKNIILSGDFFIITGSFEGNFSIQYYGNNYNIILNQDKTFEISLEYNVGLVTKDKKAFYIDKRKLALLKDIEDCTNYQISNNILLLQVDKEFCIDNIKEIIKKLIMNSI